MSAAVASTACRCSPLPDVLLTPVPSWLLQLCPSLAKWGLDLQPLHCKRPAQVQGSLRKLSRCLHLVCVVCVCVCEGCSIWREGGGGSCSWASTLLLLLQANSRLLGGLSHHTGISLPALEREWPLTQAPSTFSPRAYATGSSAQRRRHGSFTCSCASTLLSSCCRPSARFSAASAVARAWRYLPCSWSASTCSKASPQLRPIVCLRATYQSLRLSALQGYGKSAACADSVVSACRRRPCPDRRVPAPHCLRQAQPGWQPARPPSAALLLPLLLRYPHQCWMPCRACALGRKPRPPLLLLPRL